MVKIKGCTDPLSTDFDPIEHERVYGDLRERLGYPRVIPVDARVDKASAVHFSFGGDGRYRKPE